MNKLLWYALAFIALTCSYTASGQITSPVIKANFGTDADVGANYFRNAGIDGTDDWFNNMSGSGEQIIDTTGAAAIVSNYLSNPATRQISFSRLMRYQPFSVVNGKMLLDAVFTRDFHGDDSTIFALGSNKNSMNPAEWSFPIAQSTPGKNEILDVFAHARRDGASMNDSLWMFGGISIENTTGNRYFDFELCQTDMYFDVNTRQFMNVGPDSGHTSWVLDNTGRIITPGDIIFSAEFSSSALSNLEARIWVNRDMLTITPQAFNWSGQFDGAANNSQFGYASILPKTAGDFYTGLQSNSASWAGPFGLIRQNNSYVTDYQAKQFMEFSVNLSKLGLDPAAYSSNICNSPFRRVLVKTRASTSFSSELKDFVAPFRMFTYAPVDAYTPVIYFCETMPLVTLQVANPNPYAIYNWTTTDGLIVGSNNGSSVSIQYPGTYYVTQQFNSSCTPTSMDSVLIMFDTLCSILPLNITSFTAAKENRLSHLRWTVSNNQQTSQCLVEYSTDNKHFYSAGIMAAQPETATGNYEYYHNNNLSADIIYYRIQLRGVSGSKIYSPTLAVDFSKSDLTLSIYPNPAREDVWLSLPAGSQKIVSIQTIDNKGTLLFQRKATLQKGSNVFKMDELKNKPAGMYFIRVAGQGDHKTKAIILK